jgi:hypothetical protein
MQWPGGPSLISGARPVPNEEYHQTLKVTSECYNTCTVFVRQNLSVRSKIRCQREKNSEYTEVDSEEWDEVCDELKL